MSDIVVRSGEIVAQRVYDVAYSIDLVRAERLWASHINEGSSRTRLTAVPQKAVAFGVPPLLLNLPPARISIASELHDLVVSARLYDFGVVVLAARLLVADHPWQAFADRFNELDRDLRVGASSNLWTKTLTEVGNIIASALDRPSVAELEEDYLLAVVHSFEPSLDAAAVHDRVDLAMLLSGESQALSAQARADLLRRNFSYFPDDMVVLTWDRAFLYEPRDDSDVAGVIEVANAQLVEFRHYDELLDRELPDMYKRIEQARRAVSLLAARRFANEARRLYTLVAEVTELTEKIDNALQVTEDVYLARVYAAALEVFRVPKLSAAVERKLSIIRETYTALHEEAASQRAELLEIAIVLLILIEIGLALLRH